MLRLSLAGGVLPLAPGLFARGAEVYLRPDRELMVPVAGGRVYVRVNGRLDGTRPPVVMVHGGPGGSHAEFLGLLTLSEDRAVILYDQLDSGLSDRPADPKNWVIGRFVDEIDAVRQALGVSRWHVLGHSWGGTLALEYGARRPPYLAGLILASPLVSEKSWIADANILRSELPIAVQATLQRCDPPKPITPECKQATNVFYDNFLSRKPKPDGVRAYYAAHPGLHLNEKLYRHMWGTSEFVATGTLRDYDGESLLTKLDGPRTLFIDGQYDEARPATLDLFAARANSAQFAVIPDGGHAFFGDRPAEALGIVRPWLREQDGA